MYSSIVITNPINCKNKQISYKFSIIFDKINWRTMVALKLNDNEYIADFSGDMFINVLSKVSVLLQLPNDPEGKVYDGPEIKIRAVDSYTTVIWSNITNTRCEYDKAFNIPGLYVNENQQKVYDEVVLYLVKLSQKIFFDKIKEDLQNKCQK
jgi:hypothetical protein